MFALLALYGTGCHLGLELGGRVDAYCVQTDDCQCSISEDMSDGAPSKDVYQVEACRSQIGKTSSLI